jgi:hypothetical protein
VVPVGVLSGGVPDREPGGFSLTGPRIASGLVVQFQGAEHILPEPGQCVECCGIRGKVNLYERCRVTKR